MVLCARFQRSGLLTTSVRCAAAKCMSVTQKLYRKNGADSDWSDFPQPIRTHLVRVHEAWFLGWKASL